MAKCSKIGRNLAKCKRYKDTNRREVNKEARRLRLLKGFRHE